MVKKVYMEVGVMIKKGDLVRFDHRIWYNKYANDYCSHSTVLPMWLWKMFNKPSKFMKSIYTYKDGNITDELKLRDNDVFIVVEYFLRHMILKPFLVLPNNKMELEIIELEFHTYDDSDCFIIMDKKEVRMFKLKRLSGFPCIQGSI